MTPNVTADFPSATEDFINGVDDNEDLQDRLNSNHLIFTEKDHEYVNPITDKYLDLVEANFNLEYWDNGSGYYGFNSFNEYMTWAVYDLFLEGQFPEYAETLSTYWHYQNATRGFFASNLFAEKLKELYKENNGKPFENIYEPLLVWCKSVEKSVTLPKLINSDSKNAGEMGTVVIQLEFSEKMDTQRIFGTEIAEFKNGEKTGNYQYVEVTDFRWSDDGRKLNFNIDTKYDEFALTFNWWDVEKPLISRNGIFLYPASSTIFKK